MALLVVSLVLLLGAVPVVGRRAEPAAIASASFKQQSDKLLRNRLVTADLEHLVTEPALAWCAFVGSTAVGGWLLARTAGACAGLVVGAALPVVVVRLRGDQTERRIEADLPDVLEAAARNLRTGAPVLAALSSVVSADVQVRPNVLNADIAEIVHANESGVSLTECFDDWARRRSFPAVRMVASTIQVGLETGADLAGPFELAADGLRSQAALRAEVAALASQAKASALVIGLAPLAFLAVSTASGTSVQMLFASPIGALAMTCGLALDATGILWMRRVIARVVS